jgi:hypothetical protein
VSACRLRTDDTAAAGKVPRYDVRYRVPVAGVRWFRPRLSVGLHLLLVLGCVAAGDGAAQEADPPGGREKSVRIVHVDTAPVIDGRLDDPAWSRASVIEDLHELQPTEYAEPSERTTIYLLYDDEALYVGAKLWDREPDKIIARILRQGEAIWGDDWFSIILDPFHDRRSGYRLQINPNGIRHDALFQDTSRTLWDWDGIWDAAASIDADGWIAEFEIPFKTLSFDPSNDTWGINFRRAVARRDERMAWVSRNRNTDPSISGVAVGFTGLTQGLGLDVVPSLSLTEQRSFAPSGAHFDTEPSLDLFYKITPALNGALTINTDFSATEVDEVQVNLTRFGLFFPEKRAFFLQDTDIFEFGRIGAGSNSATSRASRENGRPFFSRRLGLSESGEPVDLRYGGKLTGRAGRWNIGALSIRQQAYEDVGATNVFVGRATANVFSESSVGVIATSGDPRSNLDNTLLGADFRYLNTRLPGNRTLEAEAWYQQTETDGLNGYDGAFGFGVHTPNNTGLRGGFGFKELQKNFRPALGFVNRLGVRDSTLEIGFTRRPRDRYLRSIFVGADAERVDSIGGGLQSQVVLLRPLELQNRSGDLLSLRYIDDTEVLVEPFEISEGVVLPVGEYAFAAPRLELATGAFRKVSGSFSYQDGSFFSGDRLSLEGELSWRPSKHFRTTMGYQYNDVRLPEGDFITRLARLRVEVAFSSTLAWSNLLQYDNVSGRAGINSRLHWIPEAGREAFLVVNHDLRETGDQLRSSGSEATVKVNYTFRF